MRHGGIRSPRRRLLCARGQRPRNRRTAKKTDEIVPSHGAARPALRAVGALTRLNRSAALSIANHLPVMLVEVRFRGAD
jgi:hypothetical protein